MGSPSGGSFFIGSKKRQAFSWNQIDWSSSFFLKCKNDERGKNSVKSVEADKYMTSVMAGN
ncbi:hypothetical protein ASG97_11265 [Bacillus sp. Soil745]|nr:hypothetical protein ASG97_11265 [Bacillus sp. Soil745]